MSFREELVERMLHVKEGLDKAGIEVQLTGIDFDSFWFEMLTTKDVSETVVGLYEKYEDALAVYVNVLPQGRFLICRFVNPDILKMSQSEEGPGV